MFSRIMNPSRTITRLEIPHNYVHSFTPLRGFICLMVMSYHLFCVSNGYYTIGSLCLFLEYIRPGLYIFFVISGFVITQSFINNNYKIKSYFKFLLKRIIRLYPTYLFVLALGIVYYILRNILLENDNLFEGINGNQILAHLFYAVNFTDYRWINIVFWTLSLEFQFYVFYGLIFPLIIRYRFLLLLLIIPSLVMTHMNTNVLYYFPYFAVGIAICHYYNGHSKLLEFISFSLILAGALFYMHGFAAILFMLVTYMCVFVDFSISIKPLVWLGKISYSLFLIHTIVSFAIINLAHKLNHTVFNQIIFGIIAIAGSIIAAILLNNYIELPTAKLSKKVKY